MTISVSTYCASSSMPFSAMVMRWRPSKVKGFVTTPTVRMSRSRASRAKTGAAPVPVPPPMPAVMNTMFAPSRTSEICSIASSADSLPTSGVRRDLAFGRFNAQLDFRSAMELFRACASYWLRQIHASSLDWIILIDGVSPAPLTSDYGNFSASGGSRGCC